MTDNQIVEWQGKDGQKYRAIMIQQYRFANAHYVIGRMLDTPNELYLIAVSRDGTQSFFTMSDVELQCIITGLTTAMLSATMERLDRENRPRGLPA